MTTTAESNGALSLEIANNSANGGNFILFQVYPNMDSMRMYPVAWKEAFIPQGANSRFNWTTGMEFVAGEGDVRPGVKFRKTASASANPDDTNKNTLSYNGGLSFTRADRGGSRGTLNLIIDNSIPMRGSFAAGIGMDGTAVAVGEVQPGMNYMYQINPEYRLAFGNFKQGDIIDPRNLQSTVVNFSGKSSVKAEYQQNGSWIIS